MAFTGYNIQEHTVRKILPARPFDPPLEQDCLFYTSEDSKDGLVVLLPRLAERTEAAVPYYHPKVAGLAFRYIGQPDQAVLQLDLLPLEQPDPQKADSGQVYYPISSRVYRTALQLLGMLHKHGLGLSDPVQYTKRVHHDTIVPREEYQDLYMKLKQKYLWIVDAWKENTDPMKHVFEDVGIATFLICLWKELYQADGGKPPGGFVDVGCGNGLL